MTRKEHLAWCKQRALMDLNLHGVLGLLGSLASDLKKHPETDGQFNRLLVEGMGKRLRGELESIEQVHEFLAKFV